jgi:ribosome biogenesis protein MAK21
MWHSPCFECNYLRTNLGNVKGDNRAFPYVATDDVNSVIELHTPVLFRLVRAFSVLEFEVLGYILQVYFSFFFPFLVAIQFGFILIFGASMQVHSDNFNVAVQALMLLHQLLLKNQAVSERFYRALYSVLLSPSLTSSNKVEI